MLLTEITENKIEANKKEFIDLIKSIKRESADIDGLVDYLENKTDFFVAPASTRYHGSFRGGLCEHSLAVYKILLSQANIYTTITGQTFDDDTLKIVALLHDISKVNTYEVSYSNKKVYSPEGSKWDEAGNYDWKSVKGYKTIDAENRFTFVNHEISSEFIIRQFIPLKIEESVAVICHHGGIDKTSLPPDAITQNYASYPISMYLHISDLIAAYSWA